MQEKRGILGGEKNNMVKSQPKKEVNLDIDFKKLGYQYKTILNLERDEGCYNNEYGNCEFFNKKDIDCLNCKIQRIKAILETIHFK